VTSATDAAASGLRFELIDARIRTAVESVARTDPNPADAFRGLYVSDDMALALARQPALAGVDPRLNAAAALLGFSPLETAVLGVCAAPELSPSYGRLFAYLQDDVTRKLASPRLAVSLIADGSVSEDDVWRCFDSAAPLRRSGALSLLDPNSAIPVADRAVKVRDRMVAFLLAIDLHDAHEPAPGRVIEAPRYELGRGPAIAELRAVIGGAHQTPVIVSGPDAPASTAAALGQSLLLVDAAASESGDRMADVRLRSTLEQRLLCFDGFERAAPDQVRRWIAALAERPGRLVLYTSEPESLAAHMPGAVFVVRVPEPAYGERLTAWRQLAGTPGVEDVAAKFRLSIGQIAEASEAAALSARAQGRAHPEPADLDHGARLASATGLAELALCLDPAYTWDDLVLPDRQIEVLGSVSAFLRHRDLVLSEWGYDRAVARNQGLKVLFAGESGTGKTMAAQVLAADLGLDLFRIDLAATVSKYIGETEKNLDRIFSAAEGSNAILFFDEADALFGRRSDVRDSHDRYANIEVAYLLQRMDSYPGAVILATNFRQNMDDAFLRRLDFLVDFPFPEAADRRRIWQLVLPDQAPIDGDVDTAFLAKQFKLTGGNIRNASLAGAFLAADEGTPIGMRHLVRGVAFEYSKLGRLTLESEFEQFHQVIKPPLRNG
jgi:ATPase family associated with various cellular activities (AAA)/Winged helix domain, variant